MNVKYLLAAAAAMAAVLFLVALYMTFPHEPDLRQVIIIYGDEKGDLSYIDSAYRGLFLAQETMPFAKRELVLSEQGLRTGLPAASDGQKPGLVITTGFYYAGATRQLAAVHPDVRFLAIDQSGEPLPNLRMIEVTSYGESYLAGVLAATASRNRHIGIIIGTHSDLLEGFRTGYRNGARAKDPTIVIEEVYVRENSPEGFSDPVRAGEIARGMFENGTDVIYTVAGYSGHGAITEAKRAPGRYIIGVDSDQTSLGPSVVLASAVKRIDTVVYTGIAEYLNGSFAGGMEIAGLDDGVTGLVFNPKYSAYNATVSAWQEKAREEEARYIAGMVRKPAHPE